MPSAPGTEQMSLAFRKVLHLLTRQQWPPSSFCIWKGGRETEQFLHHSNHSTLTSSSVLQPKTNPGGATHTYTRYIVHVALQNWEAKRKEGGWDGKHCLLLFRHFHLWWSEARIHPSKKELRPVCASRTPIFRECHTLIRNHIFFYFVLKGGPALLMNPLFGSWNVFILSSVITVYG